MNSIIEASGYIFLHILTSHTTGHLCNVDHFHVARTADSEHEVMHTDCTSVNQTNILLLPSDPCSLIPTVTSHSNLFHNYSRFFIIQNSCQHLHKSCSNFSVAAFPSRSQLMSTIRNSCVPKLICELNASHKEKFTDSEKSLLSLIR